MLRKNLNGKNIMEKLFYREIFCTKVSLFLGFIRGRKTFFDHQLLFSKYLS